MMAGAWPPLHHSSHLDMATDCIHDVITFLQLTGESPICCEPAEPYHRLLALLYPDAVVFLKYKLEV